MRTNPRPHLSPIERVKIEALFESGLSCAAIAKQLKRDRSTIYRELKKGVCEVVSTRLVRRLSYSAQIGQNLHDERMQDKAPPLKIGKNIAFAEFLENIIISKKYSPAAALALASKKFFETKISAPTLYRYINDGLFLKLSNKHLPSGKRNKKTAVKSLPCVRNLLKKSITDRPLAANDRQEFGHWELDTVVGKRTGGKCLLVLTERKTRKEHISVLKSKTAAEVVAALDKIQRRYGDKFCYVFKTITCDNGQEFSNNKGIEKDDRTQLFYCHAYCSWERGSNENANKLIRRFVPKHTEIERYSDKFVKGVETWINDYPRKILNWSTASEEFNKEVSKCAI